MKKIIYTRTDIEGYLGMSFSRQNEILERAALAFDVGNKDDSKKVVTGYTSSLWKKFLKAAGYVDVEDKFGHQFLVHKTRLKEFEKDLKS